MKVRCLKNKVSSTRSSIYEGLMGYPQEMKFELLINKVYQVYGIIFYNGVPWYYLCDEIYSYYPRTFPSDLFEIVDNKLSKYWIFNFYFDELNNKSETIIQYKEWALDEFYYGKLTDGEDKEVEEFKLYKIKIELEYSDNSIKLNAELLGESWVMCPVCSESWEVVLEQAMVRCPCCLNVMHNPYYKG